MLCFAKHESTSDCVLKYYLENNLEARRRELEREKELETLAPTVKAKSKMSKVHSPHV